MIYIKPKVNPAFIQFVGVIGSSFVGLAENALNQDGGVDLTRSGLQVVLPENTYLIAAFPRRAAKSE